MNTDCSGVGLLTSNEKIINRLRLRLRHRSHHHQQQQHRGKPLPADELVHQNECIMEKYQYSVIASLGCESLMSK
jgi:hypothetical protein